MASGPVDMRKSIIIGLLVVSMFIFLITALVFVFALYSHGEAVPDFLAPFLQYHIEFMVVMGLFGLFSGVVVYHLMGRTIEKQRQIVKTNTGIIMKFLTNEEREILSLLMNKDGMTTQSEIARLPGMNRLKAHRIVKKLEDRGIVHIEKYGKINMIRMVDELREQ